MNHKPEPILWWMVADRVGVRGNHKPHRTEAERAAEFPGCPSYLR